MVPCYNLTMKVSAITALVEIPAGSLLKYEVDKNGHQLSLRVDRVLKDPYPFSYGYVPNTLWFDGDPLDVIILAPEPIASLARCRVTPHAVVKMFDQGESDFKLIATLEGYTPDAKLSETVILEFLRSYKEGVEIAGVTYDPSDILTTLQTSVALARKEKK